jgi:hypothetical protein
MKKKLIVTGVASLCLIGLIIIFVILARRYSPLISSDHQAEQLDKANIDLIGQVKVDRRNFDVKINAVKDNKVVAANGQPVRSDSEPKSPVSPIVSLDINQSEDINLPNEAIKIMMNKEAITPNPIIVSAGQPVTWLVESADEWYHVLRFIDPSLKAIAVGVAGGEARLVRFNAPTITGAYTIYDEIFGVEGLMTVK